MLKSIILEAFELLCIGLFLSMLAVAAITFGG